MSTISKILGQEKPPAATNIVLYTVPDGVEAEINMFLCNQSVDSDKFRIALVSSGEALAEKHYIFYDSVYVPAATGGFFMLISPIRNRFLRLVVGFSLLLLGFILAVFHFILGFLVLTSVWKKFELFEKEKNLPWRII